MPVIGHACPLMVILIRTTRNIQAAGRNGASAMQISLAGQELHVFKIVCHGASYL
jgi:hypothetical protein